VVFFCLNFKNILFLGDESFEASSLGEASEVAQERVCDDELIVIKG